MAWHGMAWHGCIDRCYNPTFKLPHLFKVVELPRPMLTLPTPSEILTPYDRCVIRTWLTAPPFVDCNLVRIVLLLLLLLLLLRIDPLTVEEVLNRFCCFPLPNMVTRSLACTSAPSRIGRMKCFPMPRCWWCTPTTELCLEHS
jgi:hypothetical protein